jgi:Phage portal protein, SPP1 Gp6-like
MNRETAINTCREIMAGPRAYEMERLDKIADALLPWTEEHAEFLLAGSGHSEEPSTGMKWRSQTNFLPLVLDVYSQSMKVDNYLSSTTKETASPWKWWQRNKMVAKQTGLVRGALEFGVAYTTVLPSMPPPGAERPGEPGAYIRCLSPRQMTCLYGEPVEWEPGVTPVDDDWPMVALEVKDKMVRLYDEEVVHFIGIENIPESALGWRDPYYGGFGNFKYIEARRHDVGVCPVVRFRDRWLLNGEEQYGIIEPLIAIQARVDETTYNMSASEYFTAFTQRWVAGWRPQNNEQALTMAQGDTWYFSSADVKVGTFPAGDTKGYIESKQSAVRDIASISQTPAQNLGVDALVNISEATLAGLEAGKDRKSAEIQTALGESFEQLMRTCAHITGDKTASMDYGAEVKWRDATARSFAQQVDGLVKLAAGLGIPDELTWEMVPGATKEWVDRAIEVRDKQKAEMEQQMQDQPQVPPPPGQATRPGPQQPGPVPPR